MKDNMLLVNLIDYDSFNDEPLGLCYIAANLKANGIKAQVLTFDIRRLSVDDIGITILEKKGQIIGFSLYDSNVEFALKLIDYIKKNEPEVIICCGGHFATFNARNLLNINYKIDYIFKGEGEETVVDFINELNGNREFSKVAGLIYRGTSTIVETEERPLICDLDTLPWPDRSLLAVNVKRNPYSFARILTARGCVGKCKFCSTPTFYAKQPGKNWRGRSVKDVIEEIKYIDNHYGVRKFIINDASFEDPGERGIKRLNDFADALKSSKMDIRFSAFFRAETIVKYPEIMKKLNDVGLIRAFVGIESGEQKDLALYDKIATRDTNNLVIGILKEMNISLQIGFIMFHPERTLEEVIDNIRYLNKIGCGHVFSAYNTRLHIYAGTRLYHEFISNGIMKKDHPLNCRYCYIYKDENVERMANVICNKFEEYEIIDEYFYEFDFMLYSLKHSYNKIEYQEIITELEKKLLFYKTEISQIIVNAMETIISAITRNNDIDSSFWNAMDATIGNYEKELRKLRFNYLKIFKKKKMDLSKIL